MNSVALITGGSRGIGFGIAEALAQKGYHLAINGMRPEDQVEGQIRSLKKHNVDVIYCQGDIGSRDDRHRIIAKAFDHYKTINLLVNNAGIAPRVRRDILELTEDAYDELMNINLKGTFFFTQEVARRMADKKKQIPNYEACLITITSISAEVASTNRAEYCLSKAGLGMMTKLFAASLSERSIPVYEIRPGIIETDMTAGVKEKYDKLIQEGLTLEKRWGKPEDIGKIVVTLATGDLPYSTGQVIYADGGMSIRRL